MSDTSNIQVNSRFGVVDQETIVTLLNRMIEQRAMLEAAVPGGNAALLSAVLHVDEKRAEVIFDATPHADVERVVIAQPNVAFSARVDRVDVRFITGPLVKIKFEGMPAYRAPLPDAMTYMQRREFFRIEVPARHPAYCQVMVPAGDDHPPRELRTRIYDISGGGVSLFIPPGTDDILTGGANFGACKLLLPEHQPVLVGLRVRRNFRISRRQAISQVCAGCEFVDLRSAAQTTVQRYLMRLDRERIQTEREQDIG